MQNGSIGRLYSILKGQPRPILLLGAGASLRSGIPTASGVVERAARWAYAHENGVGRQLLFPVDDNYFSLSTTITSFTN